MPLHSYALTTLANVKEALGITGNTEDALLTNLINRATDIIERYCNRRFAETTYTNEEVNGMGSYILNLKHYPITSLTAVERRTGDFASPNWDALENDMYKMLDDEGQIYYAGGFTEGVRNYRVSYVAGYSTIPTDLEQACIMLISYIKNQTKTSGMKSETLGEYSYTKDDDLNATIKNLGLDEVLDMYRVPVL